MLVVGSRKILLVPKRIVSYSKEYTPQKYMQNFVLNFLQNEQLRLNGPLVQRRKDKARTKYVTKQSVLEQEEKQQIIDKNWLAQFTEKHPEIFKDFRLRTKSRIHPVSNADITFESVSSICAFLENRLREIPPGGESATVYHRTIVGIMELLFYPNLCAPTVELEIHDKRKRIDIVFDNCAETGFFSRLCNTHDIPSRYIFVECKNYSRDVANPELDQIGGRFSPNRGKVGIITCRTIDDMNTFILRCSDTYQDSRGLIIPLVDEDFFALLRFRAEDDEAAIDEYIQKRFHHIALI